MSDLLGLVAPDDAGQNVSEKLLKYTAGLWTRLVERASSKNENIWWGRLMITAEGAKSDAGDRSVMATTGC